MKRQLSFDFENEQYILKENGQIIFSIDAQELKFVSLDFYNGVYKGKSTAIELTNAIKDDKYKKGNYIFSCLNDIITSIQDEIHEPLTETLSNEAEPAKLSKVVSLYELSACAGDGFFMDGASAPEREIKTEYLDADYAVRISGKSIFASYYRRLRVDETFLLQLPHILCHRIFTHADRMADGFVTGVALVGLTILAPEQIGIEGDLTKIQTDAEYLVWYHKIVFLCTALGPFVETQSIPPVLS